MHDKTMNNKRGRNALQIVLLTVMVSPSSAFVAMGPSPAAHCRYSHVPGLLMSADVNDVAMDRRTTLSRIATGLAGAGVLTSVKGVDSLPSLASVAGAAELRGASGAIAVVGASGKTGKIAVDGLLNRGKAVRAITRQGDFSLDPQRNTADLLTSVPGDVTNLDSLKKALNGCCAVLFCASASKKGGNAEAVDYLGVVHTAEACVQLKIPRLVVISSGAVTKPDSVGFRVTNIFGKIMTFKRKGELALEEIYAKAPRDLSYTVIRPGGLTDGQFVGPSGIELNQGDTIGGTISRADVAEVLVESVLSPATENKVFEVYDKSSGGPLQGKFPSASGYERRADNYKTIFEGLTSEVGL